MQAYIVFPFWRKKVEWNKIDFLMMKTIPDFISDGLLQHVHLPVGLLQLLDPLSSLFRLIFWWQTEIRTCVTRGAAFSRAKIFWVTLLFPLLFQKKIPLLEHLIVLLQYGICMIIYQSTIASYLECYQFGFRKVECFKTNIWRPVDPTE